MAVWNYQKARNILWFIKNYFRSIIVKCTHSISRQVVYTLHFVWAFHSSCLEYVSAVNYHHFMMLRLHLFDIKFPAPIAQVCACNKNYWIFYNLLIARALCVFFIIFHSALALARFLCQKLWKSFLTRHINGMWMGELWGCDVPPTALLEINFTKIFLRILHLLKLRCFLSRLSVIYLHPLIMFSLQLSIHSIIIYSAQPF